mmetsp:Transcript_34405/g.67692  ORF Transcript_34405/g.67692 Transcript_34405/m.67692 type:complete len:612 (+) Transcript_34405:1507-3342(+)
MFFKQVPHCADSVTVLEYDFTYKHLCKCLGGRTYSQGPVIFPFDEFDGHFLAVFVHDAQRSRICARQFHERREHILETAKAEQTAFENEAPEIARLGKMFSDLGLLGEEGRRCVVTHLAALTKIKMVVPEVGTVVHLQSRCCGHVLLLHGWHRRVVPDNVRVLSVFTACGTCAGFVFVRVLSEQHPSNRPENSPAEPPAVLLLLKELWPLIYFDRRGRAPKLSLLLGRLSQYPVGPFQSPHLREQIRVALRKNLPGKQLQIPEFHHHVPHILPPPLAEHVTRLLRRLHRHDEGTLPPFAVHERTAALEDRCHVPRERGPGLLHEEAREQRHARVDLAERLHPPGPVARPQEVGGELHPHPQLMRTHTPLLAPQPANGRVGGRTEDIQHHGADISALRRKVAGGHSGGVSVVVPPQHVLPPLRRHDPARPLPLRPDGFAAYQIEYLSQVLPAQFASLLGDVPSVVGVVLEEIIRRHFTVGADVVVVLVRVEHDDAETQQVRAVGGSFGVVAEHAIGRGFATLRRAAFGEGLHDPVDLLCLPRQPEARQEHTEAVEQGLSLEMEGAAVLHEDLAVEPVPLGFVGRSERGGAFARLSEVGSYGGLIEPKGQSVA